LLLNSRKRKKSLRQRADMMRRLQNRLNNIEMQKRLKIKGLKNLNQDKDS